jgi:hypothetical protein
MLMTNPPPLAVEPVPVPLPLPPVPRWRFGRSLDEHAQMRAMVLATNMPVPGRSAETMDMDLPRMCQIES